jgi:polygalacturonase
LAQHCENIEVVGLVAIAPARSPNTGAICTSGSSRIVITGCRFDVGDDCIAINGGGSTGPARDIRVTDCTFLHGHGCSIGSDTRGGIRDMLVSHCIFRGTEMGIRLKSARGRGGVVEDVTYSDLTMVNVGHAIVISSYYPESTCPKPGRHDPAEPVTGQTPQWRGLTIRRLTATGGTKDAGLIMGLPECPATDLTLEDVQIGAPTGLRIGCAKNITLRNVQVTAGAGAPLIVEDTVDGLTR